MSLPNLLFIYTDEQAFSTLKAYGNDKIYMPNLNRLADQSCVFDRAYVTQPVCTPSRASLLTGLYPHSHLCTENNVALQKETLCLPEMLSPGSFRTAHFGKWHLGDEVFAQHGFDEWESVEDEYQDYFSPGRDRTARSSYHHWLIENGQKPKSGDKFSRQETARLPEQFGKPAFLAQRACEFLNRNRSDRFALYVNFFEPHMPFFGPRDDQYRPDEVVLPKNFDSIQDETVPLKVKIMREHFKRHGHSGLSLQSEQDWRRMIANYWGLCSLVDTYVGKILDKLAELGIYDNTLIVFTSDHGDMMGAHRLLTKCFMYEEAARVPLLVKLPNQRSGKKICGAVSQIDIVPTVLDLLSEPQPEFLEGSSLRSVILGDQVIPPDRDVIMEWNGGNNGLGDVVGSVSKRPWMLGKYTEEEIDAAMRDPIRTLYTQDGWKLNYSCELGEHELFNLVSDPLETRNVIMFTSRDVVNNLIQRIEIWQRKTGDTQRISFIS
ncbi:MAG: sulfatase-like hydrolase/transferase [Hyphomicrobiales bacterium]